MRFCSTLEKVGHDAFKNCGYLGSVQLPGLSEVLKETVDQIMHYGNLRVVWTEENNVDIRRLVGDSVVALSSDKIILKDKSLLDLR